MSKGPRYDRAAISSAPFAPFAPPPREPVALSPLAGSDASDQELMRAIADRQEQAFEELYSRFASQVYAVCIRVLRCHGDGDAVLTEVFWEIWNRADRYNPILASPRTYIMMLARSRAIDRKRVVQKQSLQNGEALVDVESIAATDVGSAPDGSLAAAEDRARIQHALQQLSEVQRDTINLAYFDGLTHREIAERLGKPLGTIKTHIRQAILKLREALRARSQDGHGT